jgi:DNA polymerase-3 subunit delta'
MKKDTEIKEITWLDDLCGNLARSLADGRLGHAILLSGPAGTGKRALAEWLCARYLAGGSGPARPAWPSAERRHPDAVTITPEEGKSRISVDQIRALVADMGLKSHAGGGKAAVIEPADAMTLNAANSLLKTLEEPPGDALIVLVADTLSGMPATILSRCATLRVALPPPSMALAWLQELGEQADWAEALALAGGAPLRAVTCVREGTAELPARFRTDLGEVVSGRLGPLDAAARWAKADAPFAMDWLERLVGELIRGRIAGRSRAPAGVMPESVLQRMDTRNLFCYLDRLNRLRNQPPGTANEQQLALESLLIPWAEGFRGEGADLERSPTGASPGGGPG